MKIQEPLIRDFMTLQPQTIEGLESIEAARKMMSKYGIRHLPVTAEGIIVGMLSERELNLALGIESVDPSQLPVADVCSDKPYIVPPGKPLREVVDFMAKRHVGSAIIMENAHLVGIFTTVDACRALHDLLEKTMEEARRRSINVGGGHGRS